MPSFGETIWDLIEFEDVVASLEMPEWMMPPVHSSIDQNMGMIMDSIANNTIEEDGFLFVGVTEYDFATVNLDPHRAFLLAEAFNENIDMINDMVQEALEDQAFEDDDFGMGLGRGGGVIDKVMDFFGF